MGISSSAADEGIRSGRKYRGLKKGLFDVSAKAESWSDREANGVTAAVQQAFKDGEVRQVGRRADGKMPGYVPVDAAAKSVKDNGVAGLAARPQQRVHQTGGQHTIWFRRDRFVQRSQAGPHEESDGLPMTNVDLRTRAISVGGGVERNRNHKAWRQGPEHG